MPPTTPWSNTASAAASSHRPTRTSPLFRPVTVSSYANNRNAGNLAVDGSQTSYWESAPGGGTPTDQFLYVDLKVEPARFTASSSTGAVAANNYTLDVSEQRHRLDPGKDHHQQRHARAC